MVQKRLYQEEKWGIYIDIWMKGDYDYEKNILCCQKNYNIFLRADYI